MTTEVWLVMYVQKNIRLKQIRNSSSYEPVF